MITPSDKLRVVLTNRCNLDCAFCVDSAIRQEMQGIKAEFISLENVERAINFAKENGVTEFTLTGGEPTLHPRIVEICRLIKSHGFKIKMITNYILSDVVKSLDGILDDVTISFYDQELPVEGDFKFTKLKLSIILDKKDFSKLEDLDYYINRYSGLFKVTFRTMWRSSSYCEYQQVDFLSDLDKLETGLHDRGRVTNYYKGHRIYRIDLPKEGPEADYPNHKMHVDGTIARDFADVYRDIQKLNDEHHSLKRVYRDTKNLCERKAIAENPIFAMSKSQIEWVLGNELTRDLVANFSCFGGEMKIEEFMPGSDEPEGGYARKRLLIFCGPNASGKTTINKIFRSAYENHHFFAARKFMHLSKADAKLLCVRKRFEVLEKGEALILHIHYGKDNIYDMINFAKARGYIVDLVFATKLHPNYNLKMEWIRLGYANRTPVPVDDIYYRYQKALETFPVLFNMVDNARFFDTTDIPPILHIDKRGSKVEIYPEKSWFVENMLRSMPEMGSWDRERFEALTKSS